MGRQRYNPIENHGVIGDLHTVALVAMDGSIDFMCYPHFDSPSIFAALLDDAKGGCFRLAPTFEDVRHRQLYMPDSNILLTRFLSQDGVAEVSDFMPIQELGHQHDLVRRAKTVRGEVQFRLLFQPAFNYARSGHRIEQREGEVLFFSDGPDGVALRLRSPVPLKIIDGAAHAEFILPETETATFIMEELRPAEESRSSHPDYARDAFKETMNFWRAWLRRSTYRGSWREMVNRSALALKLLVSRPHGSIVASPTFGLPEDIGGVRNWDYRYTWVRDASFTLYALNRLGYTEESARFMDWIETRCEQLDEHGALKIMYTIDGRSELEEFELDHLEGYMGSRPVRVGNMAAHQLQLDIYGELIDAIYLFDKHHRPISYHMWQTITQMMAWLEKNWHRPDEGIWEVRSGTHEFLFSRLMCWVAFDRAIRLAHKRSLPGPLDRWLKIRDTIYLEIMDKFWDNEQKMFIMYKGGDRLDAAILMMPLVKFISPTDPRFLSTLKAIERYLIEDSLVFRYQNKKGEASWDGIHGLEGTFNMCSFWYTECLSRAGDLEKARFYFEKMLGYANHVGLYSEMLGPAGEQLGNFPQAFTHIALISAAYDINRRLEAQGMS